MEIIKTVFKTSFSILKAHKNCFGSFISECGNYNIEALGRMVLLFHNTAYGPQIFVVNCRNLVPSLTNIINKADPYLKIIRRTNFQREFKSKSKKRYRTNNPDFDFRINMYLLIHYLPDSISLFLYVEMI